MTVDISISGSVSEPEVQALYRANAWSSADKPTELVAALNNSHTLVTARMQDQLIGLGNAISDGHLVVYYPHLLVLPAYQGRGIGRKLLATMQTRYSGFHQQILLADGKAINFYRQSGFERAGGTAPMWIYSGTDH